MNYTYQLTGRGLCSELNSLMGFYESVKNQKCKIYVDANNSQYFKRASIYEIFNFPHIFVADPQPESKKISSTEWKKSARRGYKTALSNEQCQELFIYTSQFQEKIDSCISRLSLPAQYVCFHIRRGDKVNERLSMTSSLPRGESLRYEFSDYIDKLKKSFANFQSIFIMTDDYKCIKEGAAYLCDNHLPIEIFSLVKSTQLGHSTILDRNSKKAYAEEELVQFFAEIEIAKKSKVFVGTQSSNIYRYINDQCVSQTQFISLD